MNITPFTIYIIDMLDTIRFFVGMFVALSLCSSALLTWVWIESNALCDDDDEKHNTTYYQRCVKSFRHATISTVCFITFIIIFMFTPSSATYSKMHGIPATPSERVHDCNCHCKG